VSASNGGWTGAAMGSIAELGTTVPGVVTEVYVKPA
jgi:hypothetical protein